MSADRTARVTIDPDRLWQRHLEMAKIGGTPKGGVNRQALTPEDNRAHLLLAERARARGWRVFLDDIGNMFLRREGTDPDAPPVMSGSHTDTQPTGGRFDGIFGVLAAFEAMEAIDEAGIATRRPLECAVWNNEEGSRFTPGCLGSAVHCGVFTLDYGLSRTDAQGISMGEAVRELRATLPFAAHRPLQSPVAAFIEAHIEQGPVLEATGHQIGIVTGMQGNRRFAVEVIGEDAHSGTTPRKARKDALMAAVDIVQALRALFQDEQDVLRFTIGRFEVFPGAISVVPGRVFFTIDFRHPSQETLTRLGDLVDGVCRQHRGPCEVTVTDTSSAVPVDFAPTVPDAVTAAARARGYKAMPIYSGAGHDARYLHRLCPAGMLFVPCERGISHNEAENAKPEDLAAGCQVVADVMLDLADRL